MARSAMDGTGRIFIRTYSALGKIFMTLTTWHTIFLALLAISVFIQAGLMLGLYFGMRRAENLYNRWAPVILKKLGPMSVLIQEKTHVYGDKSSRLIDGIASYTQRIGSMISVQLENTSQGIHNTDQRYIRPAAAMIPSKKKAARPADRPGVL